MRKWWGSLASVGMVCVLATAVEAGTIIRWGDVLAADHPSVMMIARIAKQVTEKTQGRVEIQVYPASQLGSSKDQIEAVALGTQQMVTEGAANFGQWVPSISIVEAPYVWRDDVHLTKVMSGPIGQDLNKQLVEKRGMRILGTTYYGVRQLTTTNKAVRTAADMKEFKLRVPENEVFLAMARSWGAKPTPMTFSELYLALRQNVVDGQENPLPTIDSGKFFEVQKFVSATNHVYATNIILVSKRFWDKLSPAEQKIMQDAADETRTYQRQVSRAAAQKAVAELQAKGMQFNEVAQAEQARMAQIAKPVTDKFAASYDPTIVKLYNDELARGRR